MIKAEKKRAPLILLVINLINNSGSLDKKWTEKDHCNFVFLMCTKPFPQYFRYRCRTDERKYVYSVGNYATMSV